MEQEEKDKLAKKAFDIMMGKNNVIELSELGKKEMDKPALSKPDIENNPGGSHLLPPDLTLKEQKWFIKSVNMFAELKIISDNHHIEGNCPIEWFKFS